jgi:hypothetical protein
MRDNLAWYLLFNPSCRISGQGFTFVSRSQRRLQLLGSQVERRQLVFCCRHCSVASLLSSIRWFNVLFSSKSINFRNRAKFFLRRQLIELKRWKNNKNSLITFVSSLRKATNWIRDLESVTDFCK